MWNTSTKIEIQYIGIPGLFYDIVGAYVITIYTVQNMWRTAD